MKIYKYLLVFFLVIFLTSCGISSNSSSNEKEIEKKDKRTVEINKIISTSDDYALIKGNDNNIYLIDNNDNSYGLIESDSRFSLYQVNNNGYIYTSSNDESKVLDKYGKLIFSSNNDTYYIYGISSDNYIIRKNKNDYEVIDMSGKVIHKNLKFETYPIYIGGNYFISNNKLFNIKSGAIKDIKVSINLDNYFNYLKDNYMKKYKEIGTDTLLFENKYLIEENMSVKIIDYNKIMPVSDLLYLNIKDNKLYFYGNFLVKKLNIIGQVKTLYFDEEKYYVGTDDGFYYIFDKAFNEVITPIKLGNKIKLINKYGVFVNKESTNRKTALYDFQGELKKDFGDYYLYDYQDFVAKSFIDGVTDDTPCFNINTFNEIKLYN